MIGYEFLVFAVLLGLIPAAIAQRKGHSFGAWWLAGALLFIVALPCALLLKPKAGRDQKQCPDCMAFVPSAAAVCSHCRYRFPPADQRRAAAEKAKSADRAMLAVILIAGFVIAGVGASLVFAFAA